MGDHWLQKMRTYFTRIDFDGDGQITRADFEGMAKRFADSGKLSKEKADDLFSTLTAVWDKFLSGVGGGDGISKENFVGAMKKLVNDPGLKVWDKYLSAVGGGDGIKKEGFIGAMQKLLNDPKLKETIQGPLPLFFHAVDSNDDGFIDSGEYQKFFKLLGLDEKTADASFKAIDTNNDGLLSTDEFKEAGTQFFLSKDANCPTRFFWGPLVE